MHCFLSKPSVESALVGKSSDMALKRENVERSKMHAIIGTKEEISKIIQKSDKKVDKNRRLLESHIQNQQESLEARI